MSCLPKPILRGHIRRRGLKAIAGAIAFGVMNGSLYHFLVAVPRHEAFENFLKTYDADAHYKELVKYGYTNLDFFVEEIKAMES